MDIDIRQTVRGDIDIRKTVRGDIDIRQTVRGDIVGMCVDISQAVSLVLTLIRQTVRWVLTLVRWLDHCDRCISLTVFLLVLFNL